MMVQVLPTALEATLSHFQFMVLSTELMNVSAMFQVIMNSKIHPAEYGADFTKNLITL